MRDQVVAQAISRIGNPDPTEFWSDVLIDPKPPYPPAWCGAFTLWCIRHGTGTSILWTIGLGFAGRYLQRVAIPEPGDVAYYDKPFQHHAIVEIVEGEIVHTIDGNQGPPQTCKRNQRALAKGVYYSIASLLRDTEPAPPPSLAEIQHALNTQIIESADPRPNLINVDGKPSPELTSALAWFQGVRGLPITGEATALTLAKLGL